MPSETTARTRATRKPRGATSGATTPSVTIARDGVVISTVSNPGPGGGTYIDNVGIKGTGTYIYQVCESGTGGACSNLATVTF